MKRKRKRKKKRGLTIGEKILKGELIYCPVCGLPPEYCEFGPDFNACKPWIIKNCPQLYPALVNDKKKDGEAEKKRQKRGGKGQTKPAKNAKEEGDEEVEEKSGAKVIISIAQRTNRKSCTTILGLEHFGVKLKVASQLFRKKFACGANVVGEGAIEVQGDFGDDLIELIKSQDDWGITDDDIVVQDEGKKLKTRKKNTRPRGKKGKAGKILDSNAT